MMMPLVPMTTAMLQFSANSFAFIVVMAVEALL